MRRVKRILGAHHVAANITRPAGDQYRHRFVRSLAFAYSDLIKAALFGAAGSAFGGNSGKGAAGRRQELLRSNLAHAAVMAKPAGRFVAWPAPQLSLHLPRFRQPVN